MNPSDEPSSTAGTVDSDESLIRPAVDVEAFSAFYRAEVRGLVNFLIWMGAGPAAAADLAQDTLIDAYRGWADIAHPRAWVRRVASRKYLRQLMHDETPVDPADEAGPLLLKATQNEIAAWEQRHDVLRLVATLPPRQRQVMAWSLDGYRPEEIAAELNQSPEAVRSSLLRARRALAERLREGGSA